MERTTAHFYSKSAAVSYYRSYYGTHPYCRKDSLKKATKYVEVMLEEGNISIGRPELLEDEWTYLNSNSQYVICWEEK